jgi:hypothetical protein
MKTFAHMFTAVAFVLVSSLGVSVAHGDDKTRVYGLWELEAKEGLEPKQNPLSIYEFREKSRTLYRIDTDGMQFAYNADISWISKGGELYYTRDGKNENRLLLPDDNTLRIVNSEDNLLLRRSSEKKMAAIIAERVKTFALSRRFSAIAPHEMDWDDAWNYCNSKGYRLPRVGGKSSQIFIHGSYGENTKGFGRTGEEWPASGLPPNTYWTNTKPGNNLEKRWVLFCNDDRRVEAATSATNFLLRVVCVDGSDR